GSRAEDVSVVARSSGHEVTALAAVKDVARVAPDKVVVPGAAAERDRPAVGGRVQRVIPRAARQDGPDNAGQTHAAAAAHRVEETEVGERQVHIAADAG